MTFYFRVQSVHDFAFVLRASASASEMWGRLYFLSPSLSLVERGGGGKTCAAGMGGPRSLVLLLLRRQLVERRRKEKEESIPRSSVRFVRRRGRSTYKKYIKGEKRRGSVRQPIGRRKKKPAFPAFIFVIARHQLLLFFSSFWELRGRNISFLTHGICKQCKTYIL